MAGREALSHSPTATSMNAAGGSKDEAFSALDYNLSQRRILGTIATLLVFQPSAMTIMKLLNLYSTINGLITS